VFLWGNQYPCSQGSDAGLTSGYVAVAVAVDCCACYWLFKNPGSTDKTPLIAAFRYVNIFNKIKVFS